MGAALAADVPEVSGDRPQNPERGRGPRMAGVAGARVGDATAMRRKGIVVVISEEVSASLSREFLKSKTIRMLEPETSCTRAAPGCQRRLRPGQQTETSLADDTSGYSGQHCALGGLVLVRPSGHVGD